MLPTKHAQSIGLSEILAHLGKSHRQTLRAYLALHRQIMSDPSGLTPVECEMIALVTSGLNRCSFCANVHSANLLPLLTPPRSAEWVQQLLTDCRSTALSQRERALLDYVTQLTLSPGGIGQPDLEKLRTAGLNDVEIEHATFVSATLNFTNRVAMIVGAMLTDSVT